jgi:DNA-binding XRE family transcriptional regulator
MKSLYIPYEKAFDDETSTWTLTGKDSHGRDYGVAAGRSVEQAEERLKDWVLDSLAASADDGDDRTGDLTATAPESAAVALMPLDVLPILIRLSRARRHLTQADMAERLGISQQAYSKYERPGANLGLKTVQQVERAIDEELLEFA